MAAQDIPNPGFRPQWIFIKPFIRRYARRMLAGFLALGLVDLLQVWIPRILKVAVDSLQRPGTTPRTLALYGLQILGLACSIALLRFCWRYLLLGFSRLLERDLRQNLAEHILRLDRTALFRWTTGEIMALSGNDLASVQLACGMGFVAFADAVVMTLLALGFMTAIHPGLTFIAVAPMPVLALATRFLSARLHRHFVKVQERFSELTEWARTTFTSIRLYKAYNQEEAQSRRFDRLGRAYIRNNLKVALVQGVLFPFAGFTANASLLLVLFFGGRFVIQGAITTGDFVAFIAYLHLLTWPMMAFGWVANLFQRGSTSLGRIRHLLNQRAVLRDPPEPEAVPDRPSTFAFKDLTFTYPGTEQPALNRLNLRLEKGITLLVGTSGSGKSTLCRLLARIYPVPDGTYFIDGTDVNRLRVRDVRNLMAYVPQDPLVFSDTIAANISLGNPHATRDEIERAARAAAIHEEITAMERGYDTRVGERGVRLSGGQRQRIALARALLLDRPVFILDDALSAVDLETERAVLNTLENYLQDRICLIVSHRTTAVRFARKILVMDRGRIVDQGPHFELMERNAYYRNIHLRQTFQEERFGA